MRTTGGAALGTTLGGARCLSVWVGKTCGEDMWGRHGQTGCGLSRERASDVPSARIPQRREGECREPCGRDPNCGDAVWQAKCFGRACIFVRRLQIRSLHVRQRGFVHARMNVRSTCMMWCLICVAVVSLSGAGPGAIIRGLAGRFNVFSFVCNNLGMNLGHSAQLLHSSCTAPLTAGMLRAGLEAFTSFLTLPPALCLSPRRVCVCLRPPRDRRLCDFP